MKSVAIGLIVVSVALIGCSSAERDCKTALEEYEELKGASGSALDRLHDRLLETATKHGSSSARSCRKLAHITAGLLKPVSSDNPATGSDVDRSGERAARHKERGRRRGSGSADCRRACFDSYRSQREGCYESCQCDERPTRYDRNGNPRPTRYHCADRESRRCNSTCRRQAWKDRRNCVSTCFDVQ